MKRFDEELRITRNNEIYVGSVFCGKFIFKGWDQPTPWQIILWDGRVLNMDFYDDVEMADHVAMLRANAEPTTGT